MGAVGILIPAIIAVTALSVVLHNYSKKNKLLETELSRQSAKTGYVLNQDIIAGEKITADMITEVKLSGEDSVSIENANKDMLVEKYAKCTFVKGTVLNSQCVYEEEEYSSDMRIHEFDFIEISDMLQTGDFIDIRIAYPNGEDYIVVKHKQIMAMNEMSQEQPVKDYRIHIKVTEEEILRLASAYVDMNYYPGSRIYAVSYLDQFQQSGIVNCPVNSQVFQLLGWDPNTLNYVSSEEEQQRRTVLESNLLEYAVGNEEVVAIMEQDESTVDATNFFQ